MLSWALLNEFKNQFSTSSNEWVNAGLQIATGVTGPLLTIVFLDIGVLIFLWVVIYVIKESKSAASL